MKEKQTTRLALLVIAIAVLATILLSGCATQSRCFAKFPPDTITKVETVTITQWKDTTVTVHIPGDSIFVHDTTFIFPDPVTFEPLTARLPLAHSTAWVEGGRLNLGLWIDSTTLRFKLDSAMATINTTETITETVIVEKPVKEKWPRILMWISLGGFLVSLTFFFIAMKVK